jgi:SAM-dependent methyltransferase
MQNDLRKIYDRFAETYDQNRGLFDMTDVIDDFYKRLPCRTGNLLDLGCGAGEPFPAYFIEQGWRVTGVDFSS